MPDSNLPFLSIGELSQLYRQGKASPVDAINAVLDRIERYNPQINAFTLIDGDGARRAAGESAARWTRGEERGPLEGVPFTVKDNLMVAGFPFRRGSLVTPTTAVKEDAPIVARCRESGAVFIGLTTMPEFGVGPVTISPLTGVTRNPWNTSKQSGGSSGGAAAGLAAGFCNFAIGSDAGGSIRIPASLCGVVGLKPSAGRVPMYPASAAGTLSCNGPLTRTVEDAATILSCAAKPDVRDGIASLTNDISVPTGGLNDPSKLRVAASGTLGFAALVHPEVNAAFQQAAAGFATMGCNVSYEDPPVSDPIDTYLTLLRAGYQFSLRNVAKDEVNRDKLSPPIKEVLFETELVTLVHYLEAVEQCQVFARRFTEFHARYDILLTPTVAWPAFAADRHYPADYEKFANRRAWAPFTSLFNLTGQPAISIPIGLTSEGLPIGLQIVGPRGGENTVLKAAAAYEKTAGLRGRAPLQ